MLYPCNKNHPNIVSYYEKYFNKLNIEGFGFTNGHKCSDVHKFEKLNNLSINIFELDFHQGQNKWKHLIISFEVSKTDSDRVGDLIICKNHMLSLKNQMYF